MTDRTQIVHENFLRRVSAGDFPNGKEPIGPLEFDTALEVYRSQCLSRALDIQSRVMQKAGYGFYTIGSSGHEGMAAVAAALNPSDMAFLHYRDAAFQIQRSKQVPNQNIALDMLLSFACSSDDPISGGRHKVLGSKSLNIPPQTSTIASHLPKAVGAAYSLGLAKRIRTEHPVLADNSIIVCSFGDASVNHSTAQGAFNTAQWTAYQKISLPLLFICEDNGIGISTKTPKNWITATFSQRPALRYFSCDGLDIFDTFKVAQEASAFVRKDRKPAFLHVRTVRLYGHAGADLQTTYMPQKDIDREEANDPLLHSVRLLTETGRISTDDTIEIYLETLRSVETLSKDVRKRPHLKTADEVMASLIPPRRPFSASKAISAEIRATAFGSDTRAMGEPQVMSRLINWALTDLMLAHPEIILMGEDIGEKGGVYGVTKKLSSRFGTARVINTLLDEQSILGLSIGVAHNGFLPIPEIQFLAYLHNAEDQLRGEAATLPFFSNGQFTNPMVIRIAGLGYQKGFGGHFHNDNSLAVIRDVPGVIVACPSNGEDAVLLLRECVRLAREEQRIVVFLEPIALYATRDLHHPDDGVWMNDYPAPSKTLEFGKAGQYGDGTDLAILTFGNGVFLAHQAVEQMKEIRPRIRIIDLRWLAPLPETAILNATRDCKSILIVDETRRSGGIAEAVTALLTEHMTKPVRWLTAKDSFIATGPAYAATLPSSQGIMTAAKALINL
ncbi:MAG: thiamine pyrophosphate-dependent enzyme [Pseudomonadota bacterium]